MSDQREELVYNLGLINSGLYSDSKETLSIESIELQIKFKLHWRLTHTCHVTCEVEKVNSHFWVHSNVKHEAGPSKQPLLCHQLKQTNKKKKYCIFLSLVFLGARVHPAGGEGMEGWWPSRQDPPLEMRVFETWRRKRTRRRWSSSGSPESCWAMSSWLPGSRSSGLPAGARAPAEWWQEKQAS